MHIGWEPSSKLFVYYYAKANINLKHNTYTQAYYTLGTCTLCRNNCGINRIQKNQELIITIMPL